MPRLQCRIQHPRDTRSSQRRKANPKDPRAAAVIVSQQQNHPSRRRTDERPKPTELVLSNFGPGRPSHETDDKPHQMSFRSDVVEIGSDDAGASHGQSDMSSHDHSLSRRSNNNYPAISWLCESFLQASNNSERIAAGSPRSGVGILGLGLLEHHINMLPTMRSAGDAVPMFDHSAATATATAAATQCPRFLGWRQKVATWPLSQQEAMNNRTFAV